MKAIIHALFLLCLLGGQWAVAASFSPGPTAPSCCAGKEAQGCQHGSHGDATTCLPGQGCCVGWLAVLTPAVGPTVVDSEVMSFPAFITRGTALTYPPPLPPPR